MQTPVSTQSRKNPLRRFFSIRGMTSAIIAFVALILIYVAFGVGNPRIFSGTNIQNLLRSMSKYLIIGIGQSYLLITGNIDLSIGSVVGMSAMISATLMTMGVNPVLAALITLVCCMVIGLINGVLVGQVKLPPFIATLGTMFVARGVAYMVNGNRNTDAIATGIGKEAADKFGRQCVVVAIDAKRRPDGGWNVYKNGGRVDMGIDAVEWAMRVEKLGAGEILLTSMDCDGTKAGYDLELTRTISENVSIPVIASGGAGTKEHFYDAFDQGKADAALAASLFHFKELEIMDLKRYLREKGISVRI